MKHQSLLHFGIFVFILLFTRATSVFCQDNVYNLVPFPAQFSGLNGQFVIDKSCKIVASKEALAAAQLFANQVNTATGFGLTVSTSAKGKAIVFQANKAKKCGSEGYVLRVLPDKVIVEAETPKGYFMAFKRCYNYCLLRYLAHQKQKI
jgi:hexosaminidase